MTVSSEKKSTEKKKKMAVLRTQAWRMRVKMSKKTDENKNPFSSRSKQYRSVKKVKNALPDTPNRKSNVIEKLIESTQTRQCLEEKGLILTQKARKKLNMGSVVLKSIKTKLGEVKKKGTALKKREMLSIL